MELKKRRGGLVCLGRRSEARAMRIPDEKANRVVVSIMKDMM
jgi:hypothetical protein